MTAARVVDAIGDIARLAADRPSLVELRREVLKKLGPMIGFDFGITFGLAGDAGSGTLVGFDRSIWNHAHANMQRFASDLEPLMQRAAVDRGVSDDREVLSARLRDASAFYREVIRPVGSRGFLTGVLQVKGAAPVLMQLGRGKGRAFKRAESDVLRQLLPVLALAEAVCAPPPARADPAWQTLTARERDIVDYVVLGFTNKEIALALGTSPNTVRNQLARVFKKLDVDRRPELVRRAMSTAP